MIYVTCPTCTATLSVTEENAGKVVLCPHCKQKLLVPAAAPPVPAVAAPPPVVPLPVPKPAAPVAPTTVTNSANTAVAPTRVSALGQPVTPLAQRGPSGQEMYETRCFACTARVTVLENPPEQLPMCPKCQQSFTARRMKKPYCVRVAAAALRWPGFCACCCKRANSLQRLTYTQKTETEVPQRESHSWEMPYCLHCLEHVKYQKQANELLAGATAELKRAAKKMETAAKKEGRVSGKPIIGGVVWGFLVFVLGMGVFNPFVLQLLFARATPVDALITPWVGISTIFFFVGMLLGIFLWYLGRQKLLALGERKADRAEKKVEEAQLEFQRAQTFARNTQLQAQSFLQPTCSSADLAVHYVGWEGYTHVFYFDSEPYAVAFVVMNRGNVVEPPMLLNQ